MANTRITQGVIKPNEDYDVRHINATGIITATNLNVSGVLTYEDVTNVDSIGVITARKGIVSSGVVTATAFHGDGSQLTGIDATALKDNGGNVKSGDPVVLTLPNISRVIIFFMIFNLSIIFKGVHGNAGKPLNWFFPPVE